jgi:hypothetical protein
VDDVACHQSDDRLVRIRDPERRAVDEHTHRDSCSHDHSEGHSPGRVERRAAATGRDTRIRRGGARVSRGGGYVRHLVRGKSRTTRLK